jgi:hypothetical protein
MEPEGLSPCLQGPSTGPYPGPDRSSPYHPLLSKIHFNIIHILYCEDVFLLYDFIVVCVCVLTHFDILWQVAWLRIGVLFVMLFSENGFHVMLIHKVVVLG